MYNVHQANINCAGHPSCDPRSCGVKSICIHINRSGKRFSMFYCRAIRVAVRENKNKACFCHTLYFNGYYLVKFDLNPGVQRDIGCYFDAEEMDVPVRRSGGGGE